MSEWINVQDKSLIPVDEEILLCKKSKLIVIGFYMDEGRVMKEGFWIYNDSGSVEKLEEVTHWQPLPGEPK